MEILLLITATLAFCVIVYLLHLAREFRILKVRYNDAVEECEQVTNKLGAYVNIEKTTIETMGDLIRALREQAAILADIGRMIGEHDERLMEAVKKLDDVSFADLGVDKEFSYNDDEEKRALSDDIEEIMDWNPSKSKRLKMRQKKDARKGNK